MSNLRSLILPITLLLIVIPISTLWTSSKFTSQGINVKDKQFTEPEQYLNTINTATVCNTVNLTGKPYSYNGTVRSGYLRVNKGLSVLGFTFYGKQNTADITKVPTILWLNGGPGSSSQLGNFFQLGPHFIVPGMMSPYEIVRNNHSWTRQYNVLFVDQPVGTGLSYADPTFNSSTNKTAYCTSMEQVANDFWYALKQLYQNANGCFKQLNISPSQDLIIFGESYAGKYAPAIAQKIKKQQENGGFLTGLKGVGIGDGFTHPYVILSQVGQYAYNLGLIDYQQRSKVQQMIMNATFQDRIRSWTQLHDSFDNVLDYIVEKAGNVNVYDITKYHDYPDVLISDYLEQPDTKTLWSLNQNISFSSQSSNVYQAMYQDFMKPYVDLVEDLLKRKVHVIVYNGQNDLIVQTPGTFRWVERLHYEEAEKFRDTLFSVWKTNGKTSGYTKSVGFLELKTVNNAGHLVPMDQGEAALNLVKTFVNKCIGRTTSDQ